MGSLTGKDRLLAVAAIRTKRVVVGGEEALVREMYADEFAAYLEQRKTDPRKANQYLLQLCVVDDQQQALFSIEEADQLARSLRVAMPLIKAIMDVSGLGDDEKEPDAS